MEENPKWEDFIEEHDIDVRELPDNLKHKIEKFEEMYEEYEAIDDDDDSALRNYEVKLTASDNGIMLDLQAFVAKNKPQAPAPTPKAEDGGQTPPAQPAPPQHQASDKPSWAFWM